MNMKKLIINVLRIGPDIFKDLIIYWPGPLGNFLRYRYYKRKLHFLGKKAIIDYGVHITNPSLVSIGDYTHIDRWVTLTAGKVREAERKIFIKTNQHYEYNMGEIHIGQNVHVAPYTFIVGAGGITIGDNCGIASGARIYSVSNHYCNLSDKDDTKLYAFSNAASYKEQALIIGAVVVGKNTAVGLNAVVLPGSTIGENSWVGVLSCVSGTIPPNVIASGCPAQIIKSRIKQ